MPFKDAARRSEYHSQYKVGRAQETRDFKESNPCADCGGFFPHYVMDFDHVRGVKSGGIAQGARNWPKAKLAEEIAKCDLVCANCHRIRTFNRKQY